MIKIANREWQHAAVAAAADQTYNVPILTTNLSSDTYRSDPFFNLTLNAVELSIFADAELVDRAFLSDKAAAGSADYPAAIRADEDSGIEVSDDLWVALQVEGHDEEGETSGIRLRDISAPIAAA